MTLGMPDTKGRALAVLLAIAEVSHTGTRELCSPKPALMADLGLPLPCGNILIFNEAVEPVAHVQAALKMRHWMPIPCFHSHSECLILPAARKGGHRALTTGASAIQLSLTIFVFNSYLGWSSRDFVHHRVHNRTLRDTHFKRHQRRGISAGLQVLGILQEATHPLDAFRDGVMIMMNTGFRHPSRGDAFRNGVTIMMNKF